MTDSPKRGKIDNLGLERIEYKCAKDFITYELDNLASFLKRHKVHATYSHGANGYSIKVSFDPQKAVRPESIIKLLDGQSDLQRQN